MLPRTASDEAIVEFARTHAYAVLTQDLDFSAIVALSGATAPSIVSLQLVSSRIEIANRRLRDVAAAPERGWPRQIAAPKLGLTHNLGGAGAVRELRADRRRVGGV